ncbi:MAG TPA: GtrA family protein [Clostridiaceae bacterium]|nr:GtrA family protein [Clostridiaceae bacterium]
MRVFLFAKDMLIKYKRFIMFCMVGILNTAVTYVVYRILLYFSINFQIANAIGDIAGGVNSYLWNRFWVFKDSKVKTMESAPRFVVTFLVYMFASWLLMMLSVDFIGIDERWAKLLVLPITTILNYFMNKVWTFAKRRHVE